MIAVVPFGAHHVHHLRVAHANHLVAHLGTDTLAGNLLHIGHLTAIGTLAGEGIAQGCTNGMGGGVLHMSSQVQQLILAAHLRVYGHHRETAMGQCACLVEHHGIDLRQDIQIVGTLHQHALSRCTANTSEEGEGHTDNQGAGTADHQEHQGTIEPQGEETPEGIKEGG